jgi:hypothetical protein
MTTARWYWAVAVILVGTVWFGIPERAVAQNQNTHYRIRAQHSDKCLDIQNVSVANGARLQQWDCAAGGQLNQLFNLVPTGSGTWRVVPVNSVKCLDVSGTAAAAPHGPISFFNNGALVQQWDCNTVSAQANQVMYVVSSGISDYYWIKPAHSNRCLDVVNASVANGALVQQWDCAAIAQSNQLWRLEAFGPRVPRHHIQSFGYKDHPTFTDVKNHVNTGSAAYGEVLPKLAELTSYGAKGWIDIPWVGLLKPNPKSSYPAGSSLLEANWVDRWCSYVRHLMGTMDQCQGNVFNPTPYYPTNIAYFHLDDEPFWNYHVKNGWTPVEVHAALDAAAAKIKQSFPNVPIMFVEAVPTLSTMQAPYNVDWIGFDCYGPWTNCQSSTIPAYLATLKTRLWPHQKIMLVPWASLERHEDDETPATPAEVNQLLDAADRYVELALSDPRIVALAPWVFHTQGQVGDSTWTKGLITLPTTVYAKWQFLGRALGFGVP